jgi:hypothetical protein
METLVNRTLFAPVMILATLGAAACSDTSPTDIPTPSYAAIGGQTFVANFDKGESVRLEATGTNPTYENGAAIFQGSDRGYLRTLDNYAASQVRADAIISVPESGLGGGSAMAFIGFGGGAPGWFYGEPNEGPTVYLRILPNDFYGPGLTIIDASYGGVEHLETNTNAGGSGLHRVRMTWDPSTSTVTYEVDSNYILGAEFVADATVACTVAPGTFAETGARVFVGGAASVSVDRLQVVVSN